MEQQPLIVIENTFKLRKGQIVESYKKVQGGAVTKDGDFLSVKKFIVLTEKLSTDDEKRIRELIRAQIKILFWNLYTKQNVLIPNS